MYRCHTETPLTERRLTIRKVSTYTKKTTRLWIWILCLILYPIYNISSDYESVSGICDDAVADLPDNLPGMFMIIMIINGFNLIFYMGGMSCLKHVP